MNVSEVARITGNLTKINIVSYWSGADYGTFRSNDIPEELREVKALQIIPKNEYSLVIAID